MAECDDSPAGFRRKKISPFIGNLRGSSPKDSGVGTVDGAVGIF